MIANIIKIIAKSPLYPFWLGYYKMNKANCLILNNIHGDVLEVGAGDGARKQEFMTRYKNIKTYTATDFSTWDGEFCKINERVTKYGKLAKAVFGFQKRIELDKVCSATELPFSDESFDYHLSFEALEHIDRPEKYFNEAARVLRLGGYIILSVPFLYRMHGGEPNHEMDYFRYANGFFYRVAKQNNLKITGIYCNAGFGTTCATLVNSWVIRRIMESNIATKIILFIFSPVIFFIANLFGFLADIYPDKRFATRWHIVLQKQYLAYNR